jgi:hypothetical protein
LSTATRCLQAYRLRWQIDMVFGADGEAAAHDAGWFERSESYPDGHVDLKRTWQFE